MNTSSTPDAKRNLLDLMEDSLAVEERDALERAFFEQDELFEELLAAEEELVDDLTAGSLSSATKAILDDRPELIPDLEARASLSRKLGQLATRRGAAKRREPKHFAPRSRPHRWVRPLLSAAVLILIIGPWLWWRSQTTTDVGPDAPTTWVVSPSSARSPTLPQLRMPSAGGSVTLILELDRPLPENLGPLRGTLTDDRGMVRDLGSALQIETFPWGIGVEVTIPKGAWRPGPQTLELSEVRDDGIAEPLATYQFELLQG